MPSRPNVTREPCGSRRVPKMPPSAKACRTTPEHGECDRGGADAPEIAELRRRHPLRSQDPGQEVGEIAEEVRVRPSEASPTSRSRGSPTMRLGGGRVVEEIVERVGDRQDQHRAREQLDEPERDRQIGLREREPQPASEAGERASPSALTRPPSGSRGNSGSRTRVREVQRAAARGSASTAGRCSCGRSRARSSRRDRRSLRRASGPPATRNRFQRASPSQVDRYVLPPSKRSRISTGSATSNLSGSRARRCRSRARARAPAAVPRDSFPSFSKRPRGGFDGLDDASATA